ncbi:dATP/dGTP pyrophosphohydrolase domain-containing protein [Achromobacter xylosoxidans]|uniref:dATP/dGTP pyrophosphohydrolase domain-containing protein n=1 Tax=Alcaligenes xylosoxydans xylosoxydans TaxID=85698 RepID=UPI0003323DEE|nr:dATP/dGTP pyrophosphohydrolase domain-containing protein [Achromobacter xylosoxidans]CCH09511.1 hypothetical protein NH44784_055681 [Achromobacter xylosoxidans NH44784-1996]
MTQQDDITQRLRDNADLDEAEHGNARVVQLEREAADEIERLRAQLGQRGAPVADERALDLLDTLFTAYENGTPCYEEPDSQGGYLGMAFRIDDDTFRACADLLNKERPRTAGALASAPVAKPKCAPIDDGICWSSKEIQRRQKEEDDARAAYYHSRASAPVAEPAIVGWRDPDCGRMAQKGPPHGYNRYSEALMTVAEHRALMAAALASAPVAGEVQPVAVTDHQGDVHWRHGRKAGIALYAAPQASADAFDFVAHLARQAEFSARTFGPGARVAGVCDHIRKELIDVETSGGDLKEWVDVIILGLDGAWRSGATPQEIIAAIVAKQAKNEARTWPDWRTVDPNKAIEHQRTASPYTCPSGDGSLRHPCAAHPAKASGNGGEEWSDS